MTISKAESALTAQQYSDIQDATEDLSVSVKLQRYGPVWTSHDTDASRSGNNFDVVKYGDNIVRAYAVEGPAAVQTDYLPDESGGDQVWTAIPCALADIDSGVPVSLTVTSSTLRLFYYSTGSKIKYSECTDLGVGFGVGQDVATVSDAIYLAAVSTTKVHYITENANDNRVFHYYHFNGAWSNTDSDIYWPFPITAFDAETLSGFDLLMITSDLPPLLGSRAIGAEIQTEIARVQGVVHFRQANGRWSDHDVADVIDRMDQDPSRSRLRLSYLNSMLFATYRRRGGSPDKYRVNADNQYIYTRSVVSRSKDGVSWEFPEFINSQTAPTVIIPRDDYLYSVGVDETLRSPLCAWAEQAPTEQDVTSNLVGLESMAADIRNSSIRLANEEDVLSGTLAKGEDRLQVVYELGYVTGSTPSPLRVQVATEDTVERQEPQDPPGRHIVWTSTDRLGRLNRTMSDYAAEWPNMQAGRDTYDDPTETGYGGLRHTAPYEGSWKTPGDNELHLISSNKEGIAVSTFVTDANSGGAMTAVKLATDSENEYAGIAFRVHDKDNLFFVAWYLDDDVIKIVRAKGDADDDDVRDDTVLYTSTALGWAKETWYYIRVRIRYSLVYVYTSTDGITWTKVTWIGPTTDPRELNGMPDGLEAVIADTELESYSGKLGLIGYGYSDTDNWDPVEPYWPPYVPPDVYDHGVILINQSQLGRSFDFFDVEDPSWDNIKGSITGILYNIALGPQGQAYVTSSTGLWYVSDITDISTSWTCVKTDAQATTDAGYAGEFRALCVTDAGIVYACWHSGYALYRHHYYFTGTAANVNPVAFPAIDGSYIWGPSPGASRSTHCIWTDGSTVKIGAGIDNAHGAALLHTVGGGYVGGWNDGQMVPAIWGGFVTGWDGLNLHSGWDPGTVYDTTDIRVTHGLHTTTGGDVVYRYSATDNLIVNAVQVATSAAIWTGANQGGRAIFHDDDPDKIIWVTKQSAVGAPDNIVVYTEDRFTNFDVKNGDWEAVMGAAWAGSSGSGGDAGNSSPIVFRYNADDV